MTNHQEPNLDGDGANSYSSSFQRTVVLRDWWLIKCSNEFEGKRFGVAGIETSFESRAMRVFTSSPIIKALDVFTLKASNGICITLRGFLNKERLVKNGFKPEISREFIFGFPPCWERLCNDCFQGDSFDTDINTTDKVSSPILSPCKYSKRSIEDNPTESRDKSATGSEHGKKRKSKKSKKTLRVDGNLVEPVNHSRTTFRSAEKKRKLDVSKIENPTTNDGDHGSEGLNKARSGASDVAEDECGDINNEGNECKLDDSKVQNCTNDGDHGSEALDKAKSSDIEKDECVAIDNEVISQADVCGRKHSGADDVDKLTSMSATGDSLTSEQRKGELKVTTASPQSLSIELDKSSKPGRKRKSKKNEKTLKGNAVEPMDFSGTKDKDAEKKKNFDASKIQNPTTNDGNHSSECLNKAKSNDVEKDECVAINEEVIVPVDSCGKKHSGTDGVEKLTSKNATRESLTSEQQKGKRKRTKTSLHSLLKDINNSSKPEKNRKSKKSEKTLKSDLNVIEPMNQSGSEVKEAEEDLSWGKTTRKINFDEEVTPEKESKKQKTNVVSTDSVGQKRSRSGRLLVSSLEFWRNQIPVYDMDRNLIQVKKGSENMSAPSKGK